MPLPDTIELAVTAEKTDALALTLHHADIGITKPDGGEPETIDVSYHLGGIGVVITRPGTGQRFSISLIDAIKKVAQTMVESDTSGETTERKTA